ncbi:MAG: 1-phosphofructokinase family hexose kinase [Saprospiraceae bacterium]
MILTITLNPSIDISIQIEHFEHEEKLRCQEYEKEVGGGGINVAKGLARLGLETHAIFFTAGLNGKWIKEKLIEDNLITTTVNSQGETRENVSIYDRATKKQYRLVNRGDGVTKKNQQDLIDRIMMIHPQPEYVVVSGSMPPDISASFMKKLSEWCKRIQARLIIDMPADELIQCFKYHPFLIKPNLKEFIQISKKKLSSQPDLIKEAKSWIAKKYARYVVISMGKDGGLLVTEDESIRLKPPRLKVLSTVGAGDSMVAGLIYQIVQGANLTDTLRLGLACGTASTLQLGTKLFDPAMAWKIFKMIR